MEVRGWELEWVLDLRLEVGGLGLGVGRWSASKAYKARSNLDGWI